MASSVAVKSISAIARPATKSALFPVPSGYYGSASYGNFSGSGTLSNSGYIAAALRWKCQQFGQALFCVRRRTTNGRNQFKWDTREDHPALPVLLMPGGMTAGAQTRSEWITRMVSSFELDGNAYAYKVQNLFGQTVAMRYLPFWAVLPRRDRYSFAPVDYYQFTDGAGRTFQLPVDRIVHWKQGVDPFNDALGCSALKTVAREVMTETELSKYTETQMRTAGAPRRAMTPKTAEDGVSWTPEWVELVQDEYEMQSDNGLLTLDRPVDWTEFTSKPNTMELDKMSLIPKEKILAVIDVDPALVYLTVGYGDSKNTDKKQLMANGWKSSLLPLGTSLSERLTIDILPDYGDIITERIELDLGPVWALQEDKNAAAETNQKNYISDVITKNEARNALDLDPLPDGDKTHNQYPQLINGNAGADATILNGTNGKLPNETDRAHQKGTVDVNAD